MSRIFFLAAMALALAGCVEDAPVVDEEENATPTPAPSPTEEPRVSGARSVAEETDDFLFEYSYPAEAGNIAGLAALLDARLDRLRAALAAESAEARDQARGDGFPYNKYSTGVGWSVAAETSAFLSLSAELASYTGGAHGNYGFDALVWDKQAGVALEPAAFFTSPEALDAALGERFCAELNRERGKRRGAPVEEGSDDMFDTCPPLAETTILLGSSNGRAFDRIGVLIAPYGAGPYAEGSYEFTLPVTREVIAAVEEEYRDAFAARN